MLMRRSWAILLKILEVVEDLDRLSMAEGGEVVDREREYEGERGADAENLVESFLCKTEVPSRVDEDEDFSFVVDFLKMTFEKVSSRFNELLQELNSVDFGEKFKKLVKEREDIHGRFQFCLS